MRLVKLTSKSKYRIHPKHLIKIEKPWYLEEIKLKDKVLDLGCHNGQRTLKAAKKCYQVMGVDYNNQELKIARDSAVDLGIKNIKFAYHNLEKKLELKSQSFDIVLCLDVLEHIVKRDQLLKEIKRVLKPKGMAYISIPNSQTPWKKLQKKAGINYYSDPDHKVEYSLNEIKQIFKKSKFKILKIMPIVYDTPWVGMIDLIGGLSLGLYQRLTEWKQKKVINNINKSIGFRIVVIKL